MKRKFIFISVLLSGSLWLGESAVMAQGPKAIFHTPSTPMNPKVNVNWNRFYDYAGLTDLCQQLAAAYPNLVKLETIGNSSEGRRIWALTISDFRTGDPDKKPAFYLDGNMLSNEKQASELTLYTAWYLLENYKGNAFIQELLLQKTFYIIPTVYPDAREKLLHPASATASFVIKPNSRDDDGDGRVDEDQPEDLNQDGYITYMRRKSATGKYIPDPQNPLRLILAQAGQKGEYDLLGLEGIDTDGDGLINEDPAGYKNPNSDWAWNWQPDHYQAGASKYPFALPENRAVKDFVIRHPNIAAAQNFFRQGDSFFGSDRDEETRYPLEGEEHLAKEKLEKWAETILPGYHYQVAGSGITTAHGDQLDWLKHMRGIFTFRNEVMSPLLQFNRKFASAPNHDAEQQEVERLPFLHDAYVKWVPFDHPTLGLIEIGGFKKEYTYEASGVLMEEDAHQNMMATLYQAYQTPQIELKDVLVTPLANGFSEVSATVVNARIIPTHSKHDLAHKIERPDYVTLKDSTVVSGRFQVEGEGNLFQEQTYIPAKLEVPNIPGMGAVKVKWIVKSAQPNLEIEVDSRKGGVTCLRF